MLVHQSGCGVNIRIHTGQREASGTTAWFFIACLTSVGFKYELAPCVIMSFCIVCAKKRNVATCDRVFKYSITSSNSSRKSQLADTCMHNGPFSDRPCKFSFHAQRLNTLIVIVTNSLTIWSHSNDVRCFYYPNSNPDLCDLVRTNWSRDPNSSSQVG